MHSFIRQILSSAAWMSFPVSYICSLRAIAHPAAGKSQAHPVWGSDIPVNVWVFPLLRFPGSHQVFMLLHSYCVLVFSSLASRSRTTAEIPRDCALEASFRGLPTRTKGPQKLYHGTLVQLENLFSGHTMHSRLLSDLLAPGTTPALQLPTLDMTWRLRGQAWSRLNQGLKVQIHAGAACAALEPLLCLLEPLSPWRLVRNGRSVSL